MGVHRIQDLIAFQTAREFKLEVYRLLKGSPSAQRDYRFTAQLRDAASGVESNISEGFHRFSAAEAEAFMRYALASLAEARTRLTDGAHREHWPLESCETALRWAERCRRATTAYRATQAQFAAEKRPRRSRPPVSPSRTGGR